MAVTSSREVLSLQTQCLTCILHHLEVYPENLLSLVPTRQRKDLLKSLPPLDICKLEKTSIVAGIDMNEVWYVICKLYDETDNIRITGNQNFDKRYLDYRLDEDKVHNNDDLDSNSKVKGEWRSHFFTRTAQILLHSFNPSSLPTAVVHSNNCNSLNETAECDCWGLGLDPDHQIILQRLMAVPPQSSIAKFYSDLKWRSNHFKDTAVSNYYGHLLIPFRHAPYFGEDCNTSAIDLLDMLVRTCHFQPKLLPVRCEFFFYSELYRLYLHDRDQWDNLVSDLFVEFLSSVERLEFYWIGGLKDESSTDPMGDTTSNNPMTDMPKLFLDAALATSSPKLDTICINMFSSHSSYYMPNIDSCLRNIAPLLSSSDPKDDDSMPVISSYNQLKRLHIGGIINNEHSASILSSIILHQEALEGLELRCTSRKIALDQVIEAVTSISSQPQLQYLKFSQWRVPGHQNESFKKIFDQFLDANTDYEIEVSMLNHDVVIPPTTNTTSTANLHGKVFQFFSYLGDPLVSSQAGLVFAWLHERGPKPPLRSIKLASSIQGYNEKCLLSYLSTCESLTIDYKGGLQLPSKYLDQISLNCSLKVLRLNKCTSFFSLVDKFCAMLSAVYKNSVSLKELSFQGYKFSKLPGEKLELFFRTLLSFHNLQQLTIDLRGCQWSEADLDLMLKIWRETGGEKKLASLLVDSSKHKDKLRAIVSSSEEESY